MQWNEYIYKSEKIDSILEKRIDRKKAHMESYRPFPTYTIASIKESLKLEWTYHSNAIEGNTMTIQETRYVLEEGMTVGGKSLREHFEVINHQEAIEYVEHLAHPHYCIEECDIFDLHSLVLRNIEKEIAGRYRTAGVRIGGANFIPPNAMKVPDYMEELVFWMNNEATSLHPVIAIAVFHHRFVWIHPFFDGNGRTVRLLMNLMLMKHGFPPAIILKIDRRKYYRALDAANNGNYERFILLIIQAVERSLDIYLGAIENTHDNYKPISKIVQDPRVPYGQEYISLLARRGKIDAYKERRKWLTTVEAVENYMEMRERKILMS